jgi:hypothetical protein
VAGFTACAVCGVVMAAVTALLRSDRVRLHRRLAA